MALSSRLSSSWYQPTSRPTPTGSPTATWSPRIATRSGSSSCSSGRHHRSGGGSRAPPTRLFLEAYEKVFPDTRFVQTHRDVSKVLPSVSDLYYTMLQIGNPDTDPSYVGELNMDQWGLALDRCLAFRSDPARDARFFDIGFTEFQVRPALRHPRSCTVARRRPPETNRRADARLASRQPEGQTRPTRVRRCRVRHHRRRPGQPVRQLPPPVRPVSALTAAPPCRRS